eukprot:SAG31_NODE_855_length_11461_cov_5.496215_11_plen_157_part_00
MGTGLLQEAASVCVIEKGSAEVKKLASSSVRSDAALSVSCSSKANALCTASLSPNASKNDVRYSFWYKTFASKRRFGRGISDGKNFAKVLSNFAACTTCGGSRLGKHRASLSSAANQTESASRRAVLGRTRCSVSVAQKTMEGHTCSLMQDWSWPS